MVCLATAKSHEPEHQAELQLRKGKDEKFFSSLDEQAPAASSDLTILSDQNKKKKLLVSPCISSFYCIQSL